MNKLIKKTVNDRIAFLESELDWFVKNQNLPKLAEYAATFKVEMTYLRSELCFLNNLKELL